MPSPATTAAAWRWRARKLNATPTSARLENFEVLWRQLPKGKGGQEGAAVAFSPDGKYLFLTVGDRQRFTPAQDPDQPVGKILRLTLDGKPAPGNPNFGKTGAATHSAHRSAERHRSRQDRESGQHLYVHRPEPDAGGNLGHRSPHALRPGLFARPANCGKSSTARAAATN